MCYSHDSDGERWTGAHTLSRHRASAAAASRAEPVAEHLPLALTVLLAGTFIGTISNNIVNVPLPDIMAEFGAPLASGAFVVIGFLIALAASMPISGWAGDRFGRRRVYCGALIGTAVCSVGAATAPTLELLITWRVLGGVMTAAFAPVVMGLITWMSGPERRIRAVSAWAAVNGTAQAVGPSLGGFVTQGLGWRWIFLPIAPIAVVAFVGTLILIPAYRGRRIRLDAVGAISITASSATLILAVSLLPISGVQAPLMWALLATGVLTGVVFVWHSLRTHEPFIDLRAVAQSRFARSAAAAVAHMFCLGATLLAVPLRLREFGMSSATVGLIILALPVTLVLTAPVVGVIGDRFGPRRLLRIGLAVLAFGQISLGIALTGGYPHPGVVVALLVISGLGMGFVQTLAAAGSTRTAAGATGTGQGLFNLLRFGGSAIGAAWVSTAIFLSDSQLVVFVGAGVVAAIALVCTFLGRNPEDVDPSGAVGEATGTTA